jgi:hypothetical protein
VSTPRPTGKRETVARGDADGIPLGLINGGRDVLAPPLTPESGKIRLEESKKNSERKKRK